MARADGHAREPVGVGEASSAPGSVWSKAMGNIAAACRTMTFKLTALYVSIIGLAGAIIFAVIFQQTTALLTRYASAGLVSEAQDLRGIAQRGSIAFLKALLEERLSGGDPRYYLLLDGKGQRLVGNVPAWPLGLTSGGAGQTFRVKVEGANQSTLIGALAIDLPDGHRLLVGQSLNAPGSLGRQIGWLMAAAFLILAAVGLVGGFIVSRFILRRIGEILATSRTIMAGTFTGRVAIAGTGDELDDLSKGLNVMLDRIEQLVAGLKEVSDNIAHDLKTPLNRLRQHAEAALRSNGHVSEQGYREALQKVTDEADELITTFNALLLIAKLEAGAGHDTDDVINVVEVVGDVVELYQPVADEAGRQLSFNASGPIQARANRHLVGQAVANMIDNALKYGAQAAGRPEADDITVSVGQAGQSVAIMVGDRGTGIPAEDRQRVLERFVRLDQSRTKPGTGLGLSLVAAVARLAGGEVRLEDNAPGLKIILLLPCKT